MRELDNFLVTLAQTARKLDLPLREDGWLTIPTGPAAVAFHLGRFVYHAARIGGAP